MNELDYYYYYNTTSYDQSRFDITGKVADLPLLCDMQAVYVRPHLNSNREAMHGTR
jgi:hypothetical protein